MELRQLRYFLTVAQELNITRAAERLNMSQPPLSNQIRGLEEELGVTLFVRGKRRLTLTEEGSFLLQRAAQLLDLEDKTRQELTTMKDGISGKLCLGMVEGRAPYLCARWIAGFRDDVLDRLRRGLADLAVIAAPYDSEHLEGIPVGQEPWVTMIPKDHPLAKQPGNELPLKSLVGCPLIVPSRKSRVEAIHEWFGEIGAEPDILCEMSNYMDAVALVEQGVGLSIFPQTTYTPNDLLVSKVITQPARKAEYVLVWEREHRLSPLMEAFVDYVRDFLQEDMIHSQRFRAREEEYALPGNTVSL